MRKVLIALAATAAAVASPVLANEVRVEARGGVIFNEGAEEGIAGGAVGYDFDLGDTAFVGAEVSGDKILTDGTKVSFGFNGRVGAKLGEAGKAYLVGGYNTEVCDDCEGTWTAGAGYQHNFEGGLYLKAEYKHYFVKDGGSDPDAVLLGVGFRY